MTYFLRLYILLTIILGTSLIAQAQLELSSFHADKNVVNNHSNPASFGNFKVTINLPSVLTGFYNNSFQFNEVLVKEEGELSLQVDELINRVNEKGLHFQINTALETFGLNLQFGKFAIGVNHGVRIINQTIIPKSALEFLWGGNAQFIDKTVDLGIKENFLSYHEFGIRLAYQFENKLSIGLRTRLNYGVASYQTFNDRVDIYTDPEIYQLTVTTDYSLRSGGLPRIDSDEEVGLVFDTDEILNRVLSDNRGIAIDLGLIIPVNQKLTLKASLQNIGKINWETDGYEYTSNGTFTFDGLDLKPIIEEGELSTEQLVDSISNTLNFETEEISFSTKLPTTFNIGLQYEIANNLHAGAFVFNQSYQGTSTTAFGAHLSKGFGSVLTVGTQYALLSGGSHNLGFTSAIRLGPIHIFFNTDNALPLFSPLNTQNFNFRTGINLVFGNIKKKYSKEIIEMPDL